MPMQPLRAVQLWLLVSPAWSLNVNLRGASLNVNLRGSNSSICPQGPLPQTNCPKDDVWLDELVKTDDLLAEKVFIDVGCNKATNLVRLMERYDHSGKVSVEALVNAWHSESVQNFVCEESGAPAVTVKSLGKQSAAPMGICVEPMPSTVEKLRTFGSTIGLNEEANFYLVQAAAVKDAKPGEILAFPDATAGTENLGLNAPSQGKVNVPAVTVDSIAAEKGLSKVDFLHVDVEGYDPDVLAGANKTLEVTRYVMFEVHRDLSGTAWSHTTLRSVIDSLSTKNFECYWTTNEGQLYNLEACWNPSFEATGWSNVACVKRTDPWASVMQRLSGR